jgi:hypothetical protein
VIIYHSKDAYCYPHQRNAQIYDSSANWHVCKDRALLVKHGFCESSSFIAVGEIEALAHSMLEAMCHHDGSVIAGCQNSYEIFHLLTVTVDSPMSGISTKNQSSVSLTSFNFQDCMLTYRFFNVSATSK